MLISEIINHRPGQEVFTDIIQRLGLSALTVESALSIYSGDTFGVMSWLRKCPHLTIDNRGLVTLEAWPHWHVWHEYDGMGLKFKSVDSDGLLWRYFYDLQGRKICEIRPGRSTNWIPDRTPETWQWEYDNEGRTIKETRTNGDEWAWLYDGDQLIEKTFTAANCRPVVTKYTRDGDTVTASIGGVELTKTTATGDRVTVLDCRTGMTTETVGGRIVKRGNCEWSYNERGQVLSVSREGKVITRNEYDDLGLPVELGPDIFKYEFDDDIISRVLKNNTPILWRDERRKLG